MARLNFGNYRRVYAHLWATYGQSWQVRLSFVLQAVKNACKFIALPIALSQIIAQLSAQHYDAALWWVFFFLVFSASIGVLAPFVKYVGMRGENPIYRDSTGAYFERLVGADMEYFNSNLAGYLTTATRQYCDMAIKLVRALRDTYLQNVLSIVFPILVIAWVNIWLGLVASVIFFAQAGYVVWASHKIGPLRAGVRELYRKNSGVMADIISNILTVKASTQEAAYVETVREGAHKESNLFTLKFTKQAKLVAGREVVVVFVYFLFLYLVVMMARSGAVDLAGAILAATYLSSILTGAYMFADHLDEHDDYVDAIIPAFEVLERKNTITDPEKPQILGALKGEIRFNAVTFAYDSRMDNTVLRDFSLHVPVGQKVGVVGLSGAGKSTLTKLLLRFVDVDSGSVTVDGVDVRSVRQADLRKNLAYVPQEPLLFHSSVRDNVVVSKPGATDAEVEDALRKAHAWSFVEQLPDGVQSIVGERGVKLSGGQKQRIAIARAVLQGAPVMILDEATSALDSESEQIVKDSFKEILQGKTAIVVAHRLSTLSTMDRVVVIENGCIVEDGTHDELLRTPGVYATLWKRQQMHEE